MNVRKKRRKLEGKHGGTKNKKKQRNGFNAANAKAKSNIHQHNTLHPRNFICAKIHIRHIHIFTYKT